MLTRIFPKQADNTYRGHWLAIWLLGLIAVLRLVMGGNSIINTRLVATGADGIPLETYGAAGAQAVLSLFALSGLAYVMFALLNFVVLVRYRALIPFMFLFLLVEHATRRVMLYLNPAVVHSNDGPPIGLYINLGITGVLVVGLVLSLTGRAYRDSARP